MLHVLDCLLIHTKSCLLVLSFVLYKLLLLTVSASQAACLYCRAAMLGYVILAYVEYNQELRRAAALIYSRLQQQGPGALGI